MVAGEESKELLSCQTHTDHPLCGPPYTGVVFRAWSLGVAPVPPGSLPKVLACLWQAEVKVSHDRAELGLDRKSVGYHVMSAGLRGHRQPLGCSGRGMIGRLPRRRWTHEIEGSIVPKRFRTLVPSVG